MSLAAHALSWGATRAAKVAASRTDRYLLEGDDEDDDGEGLNEEGLAEARAGGVGAEMEDAAAAARLRRRGAMRRRRKEKKAAALVDLSLVTLADFVRSPNVHLQRSAIQLVVDRAMTDQFMQLLCERCRLEDAADNLLIVQVITLLCKFEYNRPLMLRHRIRESLTALVVRFPSEVIVKMALSNLYELLSSEDGAKFDVGSSGLLAKLVDILSSGTVINQDVKHWSMVLMHHFATSGEQQSFFHLFLHLPFGHLLLTYFPPQQDAFRSQLVGVEVLPAIIKISKDSHGNTSMLKLGLNSVVKLVPLQPESTDDNLRLLLTLDLLPVFGFCLKSDDTELVYLALWLLHELSSKDIGRAELREMPMVVQGLMTLLSSNDTTTHLAALRTLKMLSHSYVPFQKTLVQARIVKKVITYLASESDDVKYWAIYILHDLAVHRESSPFSPLSCLCSVKSRD